MRFNHNLIYSFLFRTKKNIIGPKGVVADEKSDEDEESDVSQFILIIQIVKKVFCNKLYINLKRNKVKFNYLSSVG